MFLMEVKLNKEKIEKEGVYNIAEIEQLVEDAVEASSMYYHSEKNGAKRYAAAEDEHEYAHMLTFINHLKHIKEVIENTSSWTFLTIENDVIEDEEDILSEILENIKNGKRYY